MAQLKKQNSSRKYKPYKCLTQEKIDLIFKLFEEKMELRKIAMAIKLQWRNQSLPTYKKILTLK